jgi:hypothetical protein
VAGSWILNEYYDNSLQTALQDVYPEHDWQPWRFKTVARKTWSFFPNQHKFLQHVAKQRSFQSLDDWYDVTATDIDSYNGSGLLAMYNNSLFELLQANFPEHPWDSSKFVRCNSVHLTPNFNNVAIHHRESKKSGAS